MLLNYINRFQKSENAKLIDYKAMVDDVLSYDYLNDEVPASKAASVVSGLSDLVDNQEPKTIYEENYIVLD